MEADMACLDGKAHDYKLVNGQYICQREGCGHVSLHQPINYANLISQNSILRKMLEDICDCWGNLDELIEKARELLRTL